MARATPSDFGIRIQPPEFAAGLLARSGGDDGARGLNPGAAERMVRNHNLSMNTTKTADGSAGTQRGDFQVESLPVRVCADGDALAREAAALAARELQAALARQGSAAVIMATGLSQLLMLEHLSAAPGIDWSAVTMFHMDEYLGIGAEHPASFRRYLRERVENRVRPKVFHYLAGDALEPLTECARYAALLAQQPIDLCFLGVGENGHLAFNDPDVANFTDPHQVKIVKLDETCRRQQVKQGHFADVDAMPQYALTITIPALCAARTLLCLAPEQRKAAIIKEMLQGPVSPRCPASILRRQPHATLLLDRESASLLGRPV